MSTLARLSFRVPPDRMEAFAAAYEKRIVPILRAHGLEGSSDPGRKTVEDAFCRLFEVETPSLVVEKQRTLWNDPV